MITSQSKHKHNANIMKITYKHLGKVSEDLTLPMDTLAMLWRIKMLLIGASFSTFKVNRVQFGTLSRALMVEPELEKGKYTYTLEFSLEKSICEVTFFDQQAMIDNALRD